jgi:hypothetical protein
MKQRLTLWAAGLAFLAGTLLPLVFHAQPGAPQPSAPPATPRVAAANPAPQRRREIREAMRLLEDAKHELEGVEGDFHGHRVKAIEHVNKALDECQKALEAGR